VSKTYWDLPVLASLAGRQKEWYETEKHTAVLLQAILASRAAGTLHPDDLWSLFRLTWITVNGQDVSPGHWKELKVLALAQLFRRTPTILNDLPSSIHAMRLPKAVAHAAVHETGVVNFRNVWRNSCRTWCRANHHRLVGIIKEASKLSSNDQRRFDLASQIEALPPISSPSGASCVGAASVVTPVVACLDPSMKFPIVNGRESVRTLLRELGLANENLEQQVKGLINLVGQFGIQDAFMLDALGDDVAKLKLTSLQSATPAPADKREGSRLPYFDEAERTATTNSRTINYRDRHDKMTNRVKDLFKSLNLKRGTDPECWYDVLVKNYDSADRDLLIEAKPDPDRGALRIAIGQLLDYRRALPHRIGTDLAILTISRPRQSYVDLLLDLQISVLWFNSEACTTLKGEGKAWQSVHRAQTRDPLDGLPGQLLLLSMGEANEN
jgi:hypothetical protein